MQQKDTATQHSPKAVIFKEKFGGIQTHNSPILGDALANAPLTEQPVEWIRQSQPVCEVCPPGIVYCIIFMQPQQHHQQHHHAILMNLHVLMDGVSQIATGVMITMTVETTVMKLDVIVQMVQMRFLVVQVCTIYMCNVQCILMDK